jgi:hypothetical protein
LEGSVKPEDVPPSTSKFSVTSVTACGLAGFQTVAAAGSGKVAFATLAETSKRETCTIEGRAATAPDYDICVVLPSGDGFVGSISATQPYTAKMGVGLALDKSGEPVLAYTGGPTAALRCGASDILMAGVSGGKLGSPQTVAAGSQSSGMPADQAGNCAAQNVCNQGDATGYWPSVALDPVSGSMGVAFRDLHFGFADTDFNMSDVEFSRGGGSIFTVDVARGGGSYNRLAFSPTGKAAVAHYVLENKQAIWLDLETDAGWTSQRLFLGKIREQLGFGISAQGLFALAYFDNDKRMMLSYRESADGVQWTPAEDVDRDGVTGYYPSLAFDDQGNPAIAYYRCGDIGVSADGCDANKDGLYLARRRQGTWDIRKIQGEPGIYDGMYTALSFVAGKAVVAFQVASFDPVAGTSQVSLSIAKEM